MQDRINSDKAYVLGLLIAGGTIAQESFLVELPLAAWGMQPARMSNLAKDILTNVTNKFIKAYNIPVIYSIGNKRWTLHPVDKPDFKPLQDDLAYLSLPTEGVLLNNASIEVTRKKLSKLSADSFLAGIFDARASVTKSHRRFEDDAPIVCIEIPGSTRNFNIVVQLCSWMTEKGGVCDQILYNHPCMHCAENPFYRNWKKGFKIRFLAKSFLAKNSFVLQAKAIDATNLEKKQKHSDQLRCEDREPTLRMVSIHEQINSADLPEKVRGKLFFHYHHICSILGCPHAPQQKIEQLAKDFTKYISVFPLCYKGTRKSGIETYDKLHKKWFHDCNITKNRLSLKQCTEGLFPKEQYPAIETALAYLFSEELSGKRHKGKKDIILEKNARLPLDILYVDSKVGYPVALFNGDRAAIVASNDAILNRKMAKELITVKGIEFKVK